jgi:N6-adenosine-specific RNA methylase IME4
MTSADSFLSLPRRHFKAILADPPWRFKTYNEAGRQRCPDWKPFKGSPSIHYDTMSLDELCTLPVADLAAPDCCLFIWITWPLLLESLNVIEAWGFNYKTCAFDWVKAQVNQIDMFREDADVQIGMGFWTRSNSEPCLLAVRGQPKRIDAGVRMGIIEPRRQHSRKPDCVHQRIERLVAGPYLELFARKTRPGWTSWGNEVGKFDRVLAVQHDDDSDPDAVSRLPPAIVATTVLLPHLNGGLPL